VVDLHGLLVEVRLKGIVGVAQRRKRVSHFCGLIGRCRSETENNVLGQSMVHDSVAARRLASSSVTAVLTFVG
jgi:hypothetical protein